MSDIANQTRAALWDMDGTLLSSGEYHWLAWHEAMAAEKYDLTRPAFDESFGQRNDTILRAWLGGDLSDAEIARISDAKEASYRVMVQERGIELLPGVRAWLERLQAEGWKQAIATAAPLLNAQAIVAALDIEQFFEAIVSAEDVQRGKPDPQVFLLAAERLGATPEYSVVLEDAPAGLEGARRAGMGCIGIRSTHQHLEADYVVDTLEQLPNDAFDKLITAKN